MSVERIDQLGGDPHRRARSTHASFQHISCAEVTADAADVDGAMLVGEHRAARHHSDGPDPRQAGDDVLAQPVAEVFHFRVGAEGLEGQHRHQRPVVEIGRRVGDPDRRGALGRRRGFLLHARRFHAAAAQRFDLLAGRDLQLVAQCVPADLVLAQRQAALPAIEIGLHQQPVRALPELVDRHQALGKLDPRRAGFVRAKPLHRAAGGVRELQSPGAQPLRERRVIDETVGEQLASIESAGAAQGGNVVRRREALQLQRVDAGIRQVDRDLVVVDLQHVGFGRAEIGAQPQQRLPQAAAGVRVAAVAPQQARDAFARQALRRRQRQRRQQRAILPRLDEQRTTRSVTNLERAEHSHFDCWHRHPGTRHQMS